MQVATRSIAPLLAKLKQHTPLSPVEVAALSDAVTCGEAFLPDAVIAHEAAVSALHILIEGAAHRHMTLADGTRQILSIDLPGDVLDMTGFLHRRLDYSVTAVTRCTVVSIPHAALTRLITTYPNLGRALWADMARDVAVSHEWMISLGRRSGHARVAHFLCETYARLTQLGAAKNLRCAMPLTQAELADAMGLSCVHINRVLQQLRGEGLISLYAGELVIKNWNGLAEVAGFTPNYLSPCAPEIAATA